MSWYTSGSGALEFRVVIEGMPYEYVSCGAMETTSSGDRLRKNGLLRDGISLDERCDIARAAITAQSMTLRIADINLFGTYGLVLAPTQTTYLTQQCAFGDVRISVASSTGFSAGDYVELNRECMKVINTGTDATHLGVDRAQRDTTTKVHYTLDSARGTLLPQVTNLPQSVEGRRVYLYVYGPGDSLTGTGNLFWRGVCKSDARLSNGTTWSLSVDPITKILDQDLGDNLQAALVPRGIYYTASAPLVIKLFELTDANSGGTASVTERKLCVYGFFETQKDFTDALNGATPTAAWSILDGPGGVATSLSGILTQGTLTAVPLSTTQWQITLQTNGTPRHVSLQVVSPTDAHVDGEGWQHPTNRATGNQASTVIANTQYAFTYNGGVPRGTIGLSIGSESWAYADTRLARTYPLYRIYLGGGYTPTSETSAFAIKTTDGTSLVCDVTAYDATARTVDLVTDPTDFLTTRTSIFDSLTVWSGGNLPTMHVAAHYADGSVVDFLNGLTAFAVTFSTIGVAPDVRVTDFDLTQITATVAALSHTSPLVANRKYVSYSKHKLTDILAAEAQVDGCFWRLGSDGKLNLTPILLPSRGATTTAAITSSTKDVAGDFSRWERQAFGQINTVNLYTGYDAIDDKYVGPKLIRRDPTAFGQGPKARELDIKPVFTWNHDATDYTSEFTAFVAIANGILSLFAGPYLTCEVDVPFSLFNVLCGDVITITDAQAPNPSTGARGITSAYGLVMGRRWDMRAGHGTLTLLVMQGRFAGYCPAYRILSTSGSGTAYTLTCVGNDGNGSDLAPVANANNPGAYFALSDKVLVWQADTTSPTTRHGTITAISGATMDVTLTSSWAGLGGNVYYVSYDAAATSGLSSTQRDYCFAAGSTIRIAFTAAEPARQFGS